MNTLYEKLEVSENASKEVIEKAYKVLAKRYHPDLQLPEDKQKAETKMKEINEAYEILSDETKRKEYNETLAIQREDEKRKQEAERDIQQDNYTENIPYNNETSYENTQSEQIRQQSEGEYRRPDDMQRRRYEEELRRQQETMKKKMEQNMQQQYENAYYNYLRSLGYKIKERWTWKKTKNLFITILIMIIVITILWFLPPTHNMMLDLYNNNSIVKVVVNVFGNIIFAIWKTITGIFTKK